MPTSPSLHARLASSSHTISFSDRQQQQLQPHIFFICMLYMSVFLYSYMHIFFTVCIYTWVCFRKHTCTFGLMLWYMVWLIYYVCSYMNKCGPPRTSSVASLLVPPLWKRVKSDRLMLFAAWSWGHSTFFGGGDVNASALHAVVLAQTIQSCHLSTTNTTPTKIPTTNSLSLSLFR